MSGRNISRDWKEFIHFVTLEFFIQSAIVWEKEIGPIFGRILYSISSQRGVLVMLVREPVVSFSPVVSMFRFQISEVRVSMHRSACYPVMKASRLWSSASRECHSSSLCSFPIDLSIC